MWRVTRAAPTFEVYALAVVFCSPCHGDRQVHMLTGHVTTHGCDTGLAMPKQQEWEAELAKELAMQRTQQQKLS